MLQNLPAMDSNGLSDPYVKLHLLPGASKVSTKQVQWAPLNSTSKFVKQFGPIKQGAQLMGPFNMGPTYFSLKKLGRIKQDAQLYRDRIKQGPLYYF